MIASTDTNVCSIMFTLSVPLNRKHLRRVEKPLPAAVRTTSFAQFPFRYHHMNSVEQVFIACELAGNGMFPTEVNVRIRTAEGSTVSFLTDRSLLVQKDEQQSVKATRLSIDVAISVCLLPSEETDSGSRWVRVKSEGLLVA